MNVVYSLLASNVGKQLPTYLLIGCAVVVALAFLVGLSKGFRKVGKGNIYWAIAGVGFIFAYKYFYKSNPLASLLKGKMAPFRGFAWALTLMVACILIALLLYGIMSVIFAPRETWVKTSRKDYGFEYEVDQMDDDFEETLRARHRSGKKTKYKPNFFGRVGGALLCAVNTAILLAVLVGLTVLIINGTSLGKGSMKDMFTVAWVKLVRKYGLSYLFDIVTVGIVFAIAYKGFHVGLFGTFTKIVKTFGVICVVALCFAIPFVKTFADVKLFSGIIDKCISLYGKVGGKLGSILGKLTAGAIMAIVSAIVMVLINLVLRMITEQIEDIAVARVIDGALAVVLYVVVGVAVVALIWSGLYLLDYCGIFNVNNLFGEKAVMSQEFFEIADKYLKKIADKYLLKFKK